MPATSVISQPALSLIRLNTASLTTKAQLSLGWASVGLPVAKKTISLHISYGDAAMSNAIRLTLKHDAVIRRTWVIAAGIQNYG